MSVPVVTWIMPVLNGMPFLPEALASIQQQTFTDHQLYVWDNGSSDGTVECLQEWIPHRIPGKVFTGQPLSLGLSLARLLESAPSPLVARMDADDICEPHRLAVQVAHLEKHHELAVIGSERTSIDEAGNVIPPRSRFPSDYFEILHATLRSPRLMHPSTLMRRRCVAEVGGYQDLSTHEFPYWCEDYDLWLRVLSKFKVAALEERLIRYRYTPGSLTETEIRLNRASNAKRRAWLLSCADFAGLTNQDTAARLWDRKLLFALPALLKIARHFGGRDGLAVSSRLRMASFLNVAASFLRREDLITRAWLRACRTRMIRENAE